MKHKVNFWFSKFPKEKHFKIKSFERLIKRRGIFVFTSSAIAKNCFVLSKGSWVGIPFKIMNLKKSKFELLLFCNHNPFSIRLILAIRWVFLQMFFLCVNKCIVLKYLKFPVFDPKTFWIDTCFCSLSFEAEALCLRCSGSKEAG